MNKQELRDILTRCFTDEWEITFPCFGKSVVTGAGLAKLAMNQDLTYLRRLFHQHFKTNITARIVDHYGGEGEGEKYWTVVEFAYKDVSQMVKFDGHYQSHYGVDFNGWWFVKPQEVTVIDFVDD